MRLLTFILAESFREFVYFKRYSLERISSTIMLMVIFFGFVYSSATGFNNAHVVVDKFSVAHRVVGFMIWYFALDAVGHLSSTIREDLHIGILEQIALTPYPLLFNMLGRSISRFSINITIAIIMFLAFDAIFSLEIDLPLKVLPIFLLTYAGLYGLGLFFGGLTLIFKRLGPITTITRFLLLIMTGAIIPLSAFPSALQVFSNMLPMTLGLGLIKEMIFNSLSWQDVIVRREFLWFLVNSACYLFVGIKTFNALEKLARVKGTLGSY